MPSSGSRATGPRRLGGATLAALLLACAASRSPAQSSARLPSCRARPTASALPVADTAPPPAAATLRTVTDVPLPGPAVRFDYQSLDSTRGRLYLAHMGAGQVVVFDTRAQRVAGAIPGVPGVTGVWAVPELDRVYASATGLHRVVIIDARTDSIVARVGPIGFPDGIAYAPEVKKVFVSDEAGGGELVIDAVHDRATGRIPLGGEAGNTIYDPGSGCVLVAVQTRGEVAAIDPASERVVRRFPTPGVARPHGLAVDAAHRLLFVAGEANATLGVLDLRTLRVLARQRVGRDPDVLAFDPGWRRLYVAAEAGPVTVFDARGDSLVQAGTIRLPHGHTVAVAPATHLVYFPLQDLHGRPALRVMRAGAP
ncbi:MAG TPA: YncE family protein [Gemmatimonadales bacterium]|nr:YncE family protein [Gemmatimonadales bacterium]